MEINKFISKVLDELQDLKTTDRKKDYIVEELEFEIGIVISDDVNGVAKLGVKSIFATISGEISNNVSNENIQKVKIKLKPKRGNGRNNH
jgi:hypothetical protein